MTDKQQAVGRKHVAQPSEHARANAVRKIDRDVAEKDDVVSGLQHATPQIATRACDA